jgi:hypothetical protein
MSLSLDPAPVGGKSGPANSVLDKLRHVGDPQVDDLVARYLETRPVDVGPLLHQLFSSRGMPEEHPLVSEYLRAVSSASATLGDPEEIARGQRLFDLFGPEALLTLGSYALPTAYAAGNGVQAIYRARRLKDDPIRRLCDTAQMVIDVMQPRGLEPNGIGWYSTRKVRLVHALVRHQIQCDPACAWSMDWGRPINQEDQAGTLLSFSVGVLDGLKKMGARTAPEDADAYVYAWSVIGRLLGVDESLLVSTEAQGAVLARRIGERQIRPTPQGKELNDKLLGAVDSLFPLRGYAVSLTHFFLDNSVFGTQVVDALQLPEANWTRYLVQARAAQKRFLLSWLDRVPGARKRRSWVAGHVAQAMLMLKRPDGKVPFEVPERLILHWGLRRKAPPRDS